MKHDMTEGPITRQLAAFTLPLVLGHLFQLTYNAVDSVIVGRFVGTDALAAVGAVNPLMTMLILFINGLCLGAGILISNAYGAKNYAQMERQISTTGIAGLIFSVAFAAMCTLFSSQLLTLFRIRGNVHSVALVYIRIILPGMVFTFLYNFLAATLRALGDSRSALYFLMISAVLNIFGDLLFVVVLKWGAGGCALSTVLSEAFSCLCCLLYIRRRIPMLRLGKKWMVFDRSLLKTTVQYGWASAAQQATVPLGKLILQVAVNGMGSAAMAGFAAAARLEDFAYTPQQNIGHAMTTFLAQNKGAGNISRIRKGMVSGLGLEAVYGLIVSSICVLFARPLIQLFAREPEVVTLGVRYLRCVALFFLMPAFTNGVQGFFRGMGRVTVTLKATIINIATRVIGAFLLVYLFHVGIEAFAWGNAIGWISMLIYEVPLLIRLLRSELPEIVIKNQ